MSAPRAVPAPPPVAAAPEALIGLSPQGVITSWNSGALHLYGYDARTAIGAPLSLLLAPGDAASLHTLQTHLRDGTPLDQQPMRYQRQDGTWQDVVMSLAPLPDEQGRPLGAVAVVRAREDPAFFDAHDAREAAYRRIFEATSDAVFITDLDGYVVAINPAACRLHGYTHDEFIGLHRTAYIHPSCHHLVPAYVRTITAGGTFEARSLNVRKDGTTFPVEVHGTLFQYQGSPHILAVVRDVSAEVQAHEALERGVAERTHELATLLEVAHTVTSTLELRPLLSLLLDQLHTVIATSGSSLYVVEGDALHMLEHRFPPALPPLDAWRRLPLADALFWPTVREGRPFVIADVHAQTPDAQAYRALFGEHWVAIRPYCRSYLAVPLVLKHRTIGVLVLSHGDAGYFTPHRQRLAVALASQAAVAIENARLYEQAQATAALEERQRLSRELHDSVSQALYSIALGARTARALVAQDPERAAEPLDFVLTQADVALAEMRALIFALRPEALARIAQEALHNTVKHAAARTVQLSLQATAHVVVLEIADDGRGFEPTAAYPGHLGLQSMRERVERVGGILQIASAPGAGACLRVVVPLDEAASGSAPIIGSPTPAD